VSQHLAASTLSEAVFTTIHILFRREMYIQKPISAGEPVELVFDLLPTAYQFTRGKCIRMTIACANAGDFDTPLLNPAPKLQLLRNINYLSYKE
jgi:predicted acyl esterase